MENSSGRQTPGDQELDRHADELEATLSEILETANSPAEGEEVSPPATSPAAPAADEFSEEELDGLIDAAQASGLTPEQLETMQATAVMAGQQLGRPVEASAADKNRVVTPGSGMRRGVEGEWRAERWGYLCVEEERLSARSPVWVEPRGLEAHWLLLDERPQSATRETILAALAEQGVVERIDEEAIEELAAELPVEAAAERAILEAQDIRSMLAIPLVGDNSLVGFIGFDSVRREKSWPEEDVGLLRTVSEVFVNALEHRRAQTEREKLQAQLLQAQKMESVGRLAGGVAHDFNNMLGVILGYTQMALKRLDPADALHADLEEIRQAAQRSADITRQLLAFARRQPIAPRVLDLNETVEGMLKMLRQLIGEDIDLAWLPGAGLWSVHLDPGQVDQLLANLCVNARDAIAGVGQLTIETGKISFTPAYCAEHAGSVPGNYVRLAVSDTGCGMDKETLEHIFEPFFTTKGAGQGTGLGLSTIYGIVKQNEGFINVYSEPGQGTTFRIYLPRYRGETVEPAGESTVELPRSRSETVLLVEDEAAILKMGQRMLEQLGYRVLGANSPEEALRLAAEHEGRLELLITDVVMPQMNGRQLAERLLGQYPGLAVMFMSGYTANAIAHHGVLDEGVQFIQKPFTLEELAVKVRQALGEDA